MFLPSEIILIRSFRMFVIFIHSYMCQPAKYDISIVLRIAKVKNVFFAH